VFSTLSFPEYAQASGNVAPVRRFAGERSENILLAFAKLAAQPGASSFDSIKASSLNILFAW
jgi:hypothetical protein